MENRALYLVLMGSLLLGILFSAGAISMVKNETDKLSYDSAEFSSMAPNEGDIKEVWPEPERTAEEAVAPNATEENAATPGFDLFSGLSLMAALYIFAVKKG
ncbi:MAG: hypothetical protein ACP5OU_05210 [Methanothrix sp.]